jgi:VanZ family protein
MRKIARSVAPFLPALALMALIFAFSAIPSDGEDKGPIVLLARKLVHFAEYFLLTALWWWALRTKVGGRRALMPAIAIAIGYAITDELHQTLVDGRVGTWRDVLIDSAGALTAAWLIARSRLRSRAGV